MTAMPSRPWEHTGSGMVPAAGTHRETTPVFSECCKGAAGMEQDFVMLHPFCL